MKTIFKVLYLFILTFMISTNSYSIEYTYQPRFTLGYMSFDFQDNTSYFDNINLKDAQLYLGLGSTLKHKNYYIDLYWQQSGNFSDSMTNKTNNTLKNNDVTVYNSSLLKKIDSDFDQNNLSVTFGYLSNRITYFGGFKLSKSNFDMSGNFEKEERYRENELEPYYTITTKFESDTIDYDNRSLFIGCGYSISFKQGTLGGKVSISYSKMDTIRSFTVASPSIEGISKNDEAIQIRNEETENNEEDLVDVAKTETADRIFTRKQSASKDNVLGYSIGIVWNAPISKNWNYRLSFHTAQYNSDDVEHIEFQLNASIIWIIPFKASLNY